MGLFDKFKKSAPPPAEDDGVDVSGLIAGLADPDWEVRARSAQALGELGARAEAAVSVLEATISDEHGDVCLAASDALSRIRAAAH
jgi:HEAT repeat protein